MGSSEKIPFEHVEDKFISKDKCTELVNASVATLDKYESMGLLSSVKRKEGTFYKLSEIETLFYIPSSKIDEFSSDFINEKDSSINSASVVKEETTQEKVSSKTEVTTSSHSLTDNAPEKDNKIIEFPNEAVENSSIVRSLKERIELLTQENNLLSQKVEELKSNIKQANEDRDWLRRRVENAEQKEERDQMLLMSKSETIRKLVSVNDRKSIFGLMLPWKKEE